MRSNKAFASEKALTFVLDGRNTLFYRQQGVLFKVSTLESQYIV